MNIQNHSNCVRICVACILSRFCRLIEHEVKISRIVHKNFLTFLVYFAEVQHIKRNSNRARNENLHLFPSTILAAISTIHFGFNCSCFVWWFKLLLLLFANFNSGVNFDFAILQNAFCLLAYRHEYHAACVFSPQLFGVYFTTGHKQS